MPIGPEKTSNYQTAFLTINSDENKITKDTDMRGGLTLDHCRERDTVRENGSGGNLSTLS